ncbi:hypothetical protein GLOIN_2v1477902 [Rhizophagus irregularis DAOM 181602=DAOM 197198]|uniref:DUF8211 domain-containing protein n=4 Tax=Rhizophagus irregularis TaxID=588596 RepID=A0A015K9I4_RHIIW|nr:hypothetical protein GLOIN_2v1477902 [Rhizophagus irregularis DAOM 181602=DAOM 197198]EXX78452.1 hypothetical protein RirG_014900 [Rhizophagus irregularis DAOM 197198w]POG72264.1 hypothetical protein GLOIN_2v1477902 [Rhizophagus irregularis DAOM 181602=DAOM 197198]|eukprot:XP_025179130.1 hypothetical protein GLOIN_2v1477902 [Rhizophagus irregularis DAOM 181602=DAOM 197198]
MSALSYNQPNSSVAPYEPSKPCPQLDVHSNSRRYIPEGRLAKDDVSKTTIKPQDNTLPTILVNVPLPSSTLPTFSFLVSFEKFHVTAASKAGYNKIYECRHSKSFFFEVVDQIPDTNEIHLKIYTNDHYMSSTPIRYYSTSKLPNHRFQISKCLTHFFLHQRVIPRRIQNKFFNMIRLKLLDRLNLIASREGKITCSNNITKTFFNFSYKRYRFHFGIYVACNYLPTKKSLHYKTTPCRTPCPFVRNFNRHACIQHHSAIAQITHTPSEDKAASAPVNNIIHHKSIHANIIYEKYNDNSKQKIFSNRLGISYTTRYEAHNLDSLLPPYKAVGPMYTKIYENFSRMLSSNPRTAVRQKARFDRSCRRIFNSNKPKSGMALKLRQKIRLANQWKFLFYPYQRINKRIFHLKFNLGLFNRFPSVPLFRFPYDQNCTLLHLPDDRFFPPHITSALRSAIKDQDSEEEDISSTIDGRDDTSENSYRNWYIKNLIDEHYGIGASEYIDAVLLIQDSTIQLSLRDAHILGLDEDRISEIKARDRLNERLNVIKDIKDHNTSAKHYLRRTNAMEFFTQMTDNFDERMASIRKFAYGATTRKPFDKRPGASNRLNKLIIDYGRQYRDEHYPFKPYHAIIRANNIEYVKDDLGDTSDDTKILERRQKKRRAKHNHYNNYGDLIPLTKKICLFDCRDTKEDDFLPSNIDLFFKFRS